MARFQIGKTYLVRLECGLGFVNSAYTLIDEIETDRRHTLVFTNGKRRLYGKVGTLRGEHGICILTTVDGMVDPKEVIEDYELARLHESKDSTFKASQEPNTKVCARCKKEKALSFFPRHKSNKGGYATTCRECQNEERRLRYRGKKDADRDM